MKKCKKCKKPLSEYSDICPSCSYTPRAAGWKIKHLTVTVFVTCKRCRNRIVINGPRRQVQCPFCLETQELKPYNLARAISAASKNAIAGGPGYEYSIKVHHSKGPRCINCSELIPVLKHLNDIEKGKAVLCSKCGTEIPYFDAPDWIKKDQPNVLKIINAVKENSKPPSRKLLFSCITCGAGLKCKTGDERLTTCTYCARTMYLSDDAWRIIHSVHMSQSWSITYKLAWPQDLMMRKNKDEDEGDDQSLPDSKFKLLTVGFYNFCQKCGATIPINGPAHAVRCIECGKLYHVNPCLLAEGIASSAEGSRIIAFDGKKGIPAIVYTYHRPNCHSCDSHVEIYDYAARGDFSKPILCAHCGDELPQSRFPLWLKKHLPKTHLLIGSEQEKQQRDPAPAKIEPFTFIMSCDTCGTGTEQTVNTKSSRFLECGTCRATSLVPKEIWHRFHPVRKIKRWSILYKLPELKRRIYPFEYINDYISWDVRFFFEHYWEKLPEGFTEFIKKHILGFKAFINKHILRKRERVLSIIIKVRCHRCGRFVFVNGPKRTIMCSACLYENKIKPGDIVENLVMASKDMTFSYKHWWKKQMPCNECASPVKIPVSQLISGESAEVHCEKCNAIMKGGPPPKWLHKKMPGILGVFNTDDITIKRQKAKIRQKYKTVAGLDCPGCGENILTDGRMERTVTCTRCKNEVFIPDRLWRKLHPVTRARRWAVVFRGSNLSENVHR